MKQEVLDRQVRGPGTREGQRAGKGEVTEAVWLPRAGRHRRASTLIAGIAGAICARPLRTMARCNVRAAGTHTTASHHKSSRRRHDTKPGRSLVFHTLILTACPRPCLQTLPDQWDSTADAKGSSWVQP